MSHDQSHEVAYEKTSNERHDDINASIAKHIDARFDDADELYWMSQDLLRYGYLKVPDIVPDKIKNEVSAEARALLDSLAIRRDLLIEVTANSPRYMSNVRQQDIARNGQVIPAVYHSEALIDFIGRIAREPIIPNPWEFEKFIVNRQEKAGDTHGWHWGDYPYSMIWIIQAPGFDYGGMLECVPHTYWDKKNQRLEEHLIRNPIQTRGHVTGDVYMLKSDTTLHRVTPLRKDATRIIINMAWERERDRNRLVTHDTFAFRE